MILLTFMTFFIMLHFKALYNIVAASQRQAQSSRTMIVIRFSS